jgi:hypothetical protein
LTSGQLFNVGLLNKVFPLSITSQLRQSKRNSVDDGEAETEEE